MSENRGVPAKPPKPPRRRTYLGNGCEFDGADSSTLALLAAPATMVLVPSRAKQRNVPKLKYFLRHTTGPGMSEDDYVTTNPPVTKSQRSEQGKP